MIMKDSDEKASLNDYGFPPGCFVLHSVSSGRMLDVSSHSAQDGAPVILWPETDNSLVEGKPLLAYDTLHTADGRIGLRRPNALNQVSMRIFFGVCHSRSPKVFFIDTNGALCVRESGHALDIEGQSFPSLPLSSRVPRHSSRHDYRRTPCPQASPPPDTALPKCIFTSSPTVPL
jgi:WD repeat-containing protein 23